MNLKIYQSFYLPEQFASLEKQFIPYHNFENKNPEHHEYPLLVDLYSKNKDYDGYWGMMSWRFREKTQISGSQFIDLIHQNPNYDVYHFNPYYEEVTKFINPFVNGDAHHPGMVDYVNRLLTLMGHKINIKQETFDKENFIYCSYYVGNSRFWDQWMAFLETLMHLSQKDDELKRYLFETRSRHRQTVVINFPFVIERSVNLFLYLYKSEYKIKGFK